MSREYFYLFEIKNEALILSFKGSFVLESPKMEEILAERVLMIEPNGFLQVIVKWLARYLTFRFFPISTYVT